MKIAVNLFPLRPQIAGGHEFYVRNLLDALKRAGVDLTSPRPVEETFGVMEEYIDRLEKLLN